MSPPIAPRKIFFTRNWPYAIGEEYSLGADEKSSLTGSDVKCRFTTPANWRFYYHIDVEACKACSIRVGHTPGVLDMAVAEIAVALTFAAKRRVLECAASAKNGRIGATYARMLRNGFNCKILYTGTS
ncbi:D-isomer specific 2-hydroxyacid dehydrogenase catalytic domain [Phytophthora infestans]|uniref:D-isomer specific 2-hydroxyacid dehydrogenase catalytic domain n=1 Tax=Phytophthora infestans TaxID=4787 RepID=A0A8S9V5L4_PHYIN|nr:D-isomer specific 2-hydroxyacid dehydrogenase catalytic domain [Phytophthora infestans]